MKLFFDFLPIILFFTAFKYAEGHKEWASHFATGHFGFMVAGGVVGPGEAPVLLATLVVMLATVVQIAWLLLRRRKVDTMLWISFVLVTVLGAATIWFRSDTFIKWKPSVLYWLMALTFWVSQSFFHKNMLQAVMGEQLTLPDPVWHRLGFIWAGFFVLMGCLNLYVAFQYSTATWVNFKLFGAMGLMVLFTLGQGVYLNRYIGPAGAKASKEPQE